MSAHSFQIARRWSALLLVAAAAVASPPEARPYHVTHYDITVQPDLGHRLIRGFVTLDIVALKDGLTAVQLDAAEMTILSCGQGRRPLRFVRANDILTVTLPRVLRSNRKTRFTIRYEAAPRSGVRFFDDQMYTVFATSHWLPCNDRPSDRAVYTMQVVAPPGLTVVASGTLVSTRVDKGQALSTWRVDHPISTYVFGLAVGRFAAHSADTLSKSVHVTNTRPLDGGLGTLAYLVSPDHPVQSSPPPGRPESPTSHASLANSSKEETAATAPRPTGVDEPIFSTIRAAAAFFADKSGKPYPAKSYTEVFAHGDIAQEASQFTLLSEDYLVSLKNHPADSWLLAHELAHQWWGISVTCESWSDFWLNEGIATYMADAFLEHQYGKDRYMQEIDRSHQIYRELLISDQDRPLSYHGWTVPSQAGGQLPYHKGAWFLHILRQQIGDDQFWRGMRQYTRGNWGKSVTSLTFEAYFEKACECNLQNLFNAYVYAL